MAVSSLPSFVSVGHVFRLPELVLLFSLSSLPSFYLASLGSRSPGWRRRGVRFIPTVKPAGFPNQSRQLLKHGYELQCKSLPNWWTQTSMGTEGFRIRLDTWPFPVPCYTLWGRVPLSQIDKTEETTKRYPYSNLSTRKKKKETVPLFEHLKSGGPSGCQGSEFASKLGSSPVFPKPTLLQRLAPLGPDDVASRRRREALGAGAKRFGGCQNRFGIPFWGGGSVNFTTHFRTYFSGWIGIFTRITGLLTHGHLALIGRWSLAWL